MFQKGNWKIQTPQSHWKIWLKMTAGIVSPQFHSSQQLQNNFSICKFTPDCAGYCKHSSVLIGGWFYCSLLVEVYKLLRQRVGPYFVMMVVWLVYYWMWSNGGNRASLVDLSICYMMRGEVKLKSRATEVSQRWTSVNACVFI